MKSISISSISTAVHPHRLYSWKCFTPSGNNLTPKIHNHSQQKEKKILKKIKLTKYHEEDDSGTRGNRFDKLRPLNFRCKYSGNLIVFQASLIDFLPFSKFAQTKVIVLIVFHSFFFFFSSSFQNCRIFFSFFFLFFLLRMCVIFFFCDIGRTVSATMAGQCEIGEFLCKFQDFTGTAYGKKNN